MTYTIWFQSSPGMGAGRNSRKFAEGAKVTICFNPRPAWEPGATPDISSLFGAMSVSILARHGSRAQPIFAANPVIEYIPFQSSPGMGAGRNFNGSIIFDKIIPVSILARHGSRAQPVW